MIKSIIENNYNLKNESVLALCNYKGNFCFIPCDENLSGSYPRYKEAVIIKENVEDIFGEIHALLLKKYGNKYEALFVTDSWDGFQLSEVKDLNDLVEFVKWISMYI